MWVETQGESVVRNADVKTNHRTPGCRVLATAAGHLWDEGGSWQGLPRAHGWRSFTEALRKSQAGALPCLPQVRNRPGEHFAMQSANCPSVN